ncbi:MAG: TRAP transporter TatT component family protein [Acidobacteria bacterium]|nr:TRAP transporter TatT component family protein [Acidobacteriota bacterium]
MVPDRSIGVYAAARRRAALPGVAGLLVLILLFSGCSIRKLAVNKIGEAIASGGSVYETDDDLALVGQALPFSLKLMESLLAESPEHRSLLEKVCQGFAIYSYVYVQYEADILADEDFKRSRQMRERARRLYLRALGYGMRGLEEVVPGITEQLVGDPKAAAARVLKSRDVPLLYWTAVALGLAISVSKDDAELLARLPEVEALLDRAMELDESWNEGALHEFQLTLASVRPGALDYERVRRHYERALELSRGTHAALFVSYAELVSVRQQDALEFEMLLDRALSIDADAHENLRLANLVAQRRARWLLGRAEDLILMEDEEVLDEGGW